nr:nonstructural protein [Flumine marna-like virus 3]
MHRFFPTPANKNLSSPSRKSIVTEMEEMSDIIATIQRNIRNLFPRDKQLSTSLLKSIEDVVFMAIAVMGATTLKDKLLHVLAYFKYHYKGSITQDILTKITSIFSEDSNPAPISLQDINKELDAKLKNPLSYQSSPLREVLDNWDRMDESPLALKMRKLVGYCMSFSVLQSCGIPSTFADVIYAEFNVKRDLPKKVTSFLYSILDVVEFVFNRAIACWQSGSLKPMFHTSTTYTQWFDMTTKVKMWSRMLENPEDNGFTENEYIHDLEECIEKGSNMIKLATKTKDRQILTSLVVELKVLRAEHLTIKRASRMRKTPFSVLLFGETSIGKTYLTKQLLHIFSQVRKLPFDDEYHYTRNSGDEYFSGYKSSVLYVTLDDVGFMRPDCAKQGDPSVMETIKMINTAPFTPQMAELEKKGKVSFAPEIVIANTNVRSMNAECYFAHPSAVMRRFPYIIEPSVKPQYRTHGSHTLDSSKVPTFKEGCYDDLWNFTVHRVKPQLVKRPNKAANVKCDEDIILDEADQITFIKWYTSAIKSHFANQNKMVESSQVLKSVIFCEHSLPDYLCEICTPSSAMALQSDDHIDTPRSVTSSTALVPYQETYTNTEKVLLFYVFIAAFFISISEHGIWGAHWTNAQASRDSSKRLMRSTYTSIEYTMKLRKTIAEIGDRAYNKLSSRSAFLGVVAIVSAIAVCKLGMKVQEKFQEQSILETGEKPQPTKKEGINCWVNSRMKDKELVTTPQTKSYKALSKDQLIEIISRNLKFVKIRGENTPEVYKPCNILGLKGNIFSVNTHCLPETGDVIIDVIQNPSTEGITNNVKAISISRCDIHKGEGDQSFITITTLPQVKDITGLLSLRELDINANGYYIYRTPQGDITTDYVLSNINKVELEADIFEGKHQTLVATTTITTESGFCGAIMIMDTYDGPIIVGQHYLGNNKQLVGAFPLYSDNIPSTQLVTVDTSDLVLNSDSTNHKIVDLHYKSPFRYIDEGTAELYGSLDAHRNTMKSNVEPSYCSKFWQERRSIEVKYGPPDLASYRPHRLGLLPMTQQYFPLKGSKVVNARKQFVCDIIARLDPIEGELFGKYDLETAINGSDGIQYVESINMKTSAGFPVNKPKRAFFITKENQLEHPVLEVNEEIMNELKRIENCYSKGKRANPIFSSNLKDEPRPLEKVAEGKTRVFMSCPVAFTLIVRMYFLPCVRVIQRNRLAFECAVGTNAHSQDWDDIYQFICENSGWVIDGDYKNFDKSMMGMVLREAMYVLIDLTVHFTKVPEEDLQAMYCIAEDIAFSYVNYNGDLATFLRNNPSGHPLTVILNCFANSLYFRIVYQDLHPEHDISTFRDNVRPVTYGDDFVASIKPEVITWYNFNSIQTALANNGITLTRADKKEGTYHAKTIQEVDFLKRSFEYNHHLGRFTGPLSISSIEKSLVISVRSKVITPQQQMVDTMSSALREMFFHGECVFSIFLIQIKDCIAEHNLEPFVNDSHFPSYSELLRLYGSDQRLSMWVEMLNTPQEPLFLQSSDTECEPNLARKSGFPDEVLYTNQKVCPAISYCYHSGLFSQIDLESGIVGKVQTCEPSSPYLGRESSTSQPIKTNLLAYNWKLVEDDVPITNFKENYSIPCGVTTGTEAVSSVERAVESAHYKKDLVQVSRSSYSRNYRINPAISQRTCQFVYDAYPLEYQSSDMSDTVVNLQMAEDNNDVLEGYNPIRDNTFYDGYSADVALSSYLNRVALIRSYTWDEGSNFNETFYPWADFFNSPAIKRKIDNYSLLSCNLHVKVMINASPFYYGLAYMSYLPLPIYVAENSLIEVPGGQHLVPFSQRPHVSLYPQNSQGGEMTLPFFYPKNWLRVSSLQDFIDMGHMDIKSFTPLQNANSISTGGATVQVFAWATDVCVAAPTVNLALQSSDMKDFNFQSDEYEEKNGAISGPASAMSKTVSKLNELPIIGVYAKATTTILDGVAGVARYFGFTNVPNLSDSNPVRDTPFHAMASSDISTPVEKLTLDAKNELTIDPRVTGLPPTDELLISNFVARESWIWTSQWEASNAVDTVLFTTRVVPDLVRSAVDYRYATPMAFLNKYFNYWRGDIWFRFRIIGTKFHRGRLRLTYDPDGDLVTNVNTTSTSYTKIIDIADESDFKIRIPYQQALAFLETSGGDNFGRENMTAGNTTVERNPRRDNGQLCLRVFTVQTSAVASAPIQVVITCWGADNLEFAEPMEGPQDYSNFQLQSDDLKYEDITDLPVKTDEKDENRNLVFMGEKIVSLRQLLRRAAFLSSRPLVSPIGLTDRIVYNTFRMPRIPPFYGYDPNGSDTSPKIVGTGTYKSNLVTQSLLTGLFPCFVGHRGSLVYHLNTDSPTPISTIEVSRARGEASSSLPDIQSISSSGNNQLVTAYGRVLRTSGVQGRLLSNQQTQTGLSVHLPMYSNHRFLATKPNNVTNPVKVDSTEFDTFDVQIITKPSINPATEKSSDLNIYYSIGTDFGLFFFLNIPTQVRYNLPTA